ncbi:MAG: TonB-dependent receptor plug domain-containing protein [Myxococcota bacterium]
MPRTSFYVVGWLIFFGLARPALAQGTDTESGAGTRVDPEMASEPSASPTEPTVAADDGALAEPQTDGDGPEDTQIDPEFPAPEVVEVRGQSASRTLEKSAKAVSIVNLENARLRSADLGEVLARSSGISVQRGGGLGSTTRLTLNGLTDDQIRFFIDGVPLQLAGFAFGIANIPVNKLERIEVYRGVVPIEFGADALGGAINLVTSIEDGTSAGASYQLGSFGTHRATANAQVVDDDTGWLARTSAFFDTTNNNYDVDVTVPDEVGRLSDETVERFHDEYRALGVQAEVGLIEQSWADRITVGGFYNETDRDIQNNVIMVIPYGEPVSAQQSAGATLRYENNFDDRFGLQMIAGYSRTRRRLVDVSECIYNWRGECVNLRNVRGEIFSEPRDRVTLDDGFFLRLNGSLELGLDHELRLSVAPTAELRSGDERLDPPGVVDELSLERELLGVVSGVEYEFSAWEERFSNILFAKSYYQVQRAEEVGIGSEILRRDRDTGQFGFGNSLRVKTTEWLDLKASYEFATRLPEVLEVFGDGLLIESNLDIEPEESHNVNIGGQLDIDGLVVGGFRGEVNGFLREVDNLIVLTGDDRTFSYQNVFGGRVLGVEGSLNWASPNDILTLGGNTTYIDYRNTSSDGDFGAFEGDRIPNRPYLLANALARLKFDEVFQNDDQIGLDWDTRFVQEFFRNWESAGDPSFKQTVDSQLQHSVAIGYTGAWWPAQYSFSVEMQNLTNEALFDFFGVQRPGRLLFVKATLDY